MSDSTKVAHVTYVNLRKTLATGTDDRQSWGNELDPTVKGFHLVTDRFVKALDGI